jgi:pectate lyase
MKIFRLSGIVLLFLMLVTTVANASVTITSQGGWFESAYVEFIPDGSSYYNVYYSTDQSNWTKIDDQLVRKYSSSRGRADVLGIKAGTYYIKVASVNASGTETANVVSNPLIVKAHDRGGFAHFNNANKVGAYKDNGTLKSGANVLYIAKANAKTITLTVPSASNKTAIYTGLQNIINAWTKAYSSGWSSAPLAIRVLGTLSYDDMDTFSSSAEGIQIKGSSNYSDCPITFEGVGNDAVIHGFGFLIRNMSNLELRNFAIMNCLDDAVSIDSNNSHIWVHNLDLFYGNAGSDKDQVKGDGTVDMKGDSRYITVSYNHFWDTGKSSLCGMKSESGPNYITYHHNWFDHSDSRHPRIRTMSVHVYNNYFDGVSKYGTGVTMGSSCFVDRNYYRSCKYPMLSSMQGSDVYAGTTTRNPGSYGTFSGENSGIIKSYGNYMTGNCTYITYGATTYLLHGSNTSVGSINTTQDFDAYEVSNPSQTVPGTVKGYQGGSTYNNFDTDLSLMYSYTADNAIDVPTVVKGTYGAGRMQHGTYQHTFTSADDTDYGVIASLKSDVQGYKSTSYYVGVTNSMYYKENVINDSPVEPGGGEEEPETPTTSTDATLKSLTVSGYSLSFSPSQTSYSVTLAYDAESAPAVSAIANNNNATVSISQATSTTGKATVTVTAEDGVTKKIYEVQFSIGSEPAPSGSSIASAMTINVGDGNGYASYLTGTYNTSTSFTATTYHGVTNSTKCIKMETSTSIHFTTTKAFTMTFVADASQTASFKIDGTTVTGTGNIASVDVAAGPHTLTKSGAIKMCFLDFAETSTPVDPEPTQSSDATLSALSVAGYSLTPAFSSSTFTYSVELAAGTTSVPFITATPNHTKAHAYVDTESCHPTGQAIIDVEAEDGTSGKYYINFTVSEELNLTDAAEYVDGTFAAGKVTYTRSTTNGKYGSFCLPFDFNASEVDGIAKIYVPVNIVVYNTSTNKLRLFLELKTGTISAGTPFLALFNGATTVNNSASATFTSVMSNPPSVNMDVFDSNGSDGALLESEDITVTWNGTYVKTDRVDGMKSFNSNGDFGDHTAATISAFRAYLVVTSATVNSQDIDVELTLGDATGIYELTNTVESVKNVDVYTIGGIRVKSRVPYGKALDGLLPGSYIINGKIVIK